MVLGDAENANYFKTVKKIYSIRSNIVHGITIPANLKVEIDSLLTEAEGVVRQTLTKILLDEELVKIFSDTEKLKDYLDKMILNQAGS